MNGILLVLKPPGMTSFDVVAWLRGIFRVKKIGHAGTLDPAAAGLLPVCIGKATGTIDWFQDFDKSYRAEMVLGITTDTQDGEGEILQRNSVEVDADRLCSVMHGFIGEYEQIPPMYSAVKINGKRLYELARQGMELDRKSRPVKITSLKLINCKMDLEHPVVRFDVSCSKGTYIRTLCADIGQKLGCGAYMSFLVRTRVGPFHMADAFTLEEIQRYRNEDKLSSLLLPLDVVFEKYPALVPDERDLKRFLNGAAFEAEQYGVEAGFVRIYSKPDSFAGLGTASVQNGKYLVKPRKLFC